MRWQRRVEKRSSSKASTGGSSPRVAARASRPRVPSALSNGLTTHALELCFLQLIYATYNIRAPIHLGAKATGKLGPLMVNRWFLWYLTKCQKQAERVFVGCLKSDRTRIFYTQRFCHSSRFCTALQEDRISLSKWHAMSNSKRQGKRKLQSGPICWVDFDRLVYSLQEIGAKLKLNSLEVPAKFDPCIPWASPDKLRDLRNQIPESKPINQPQTLTLWSRLFLFLNFLRDAEYFYLTAVRTSLILTSWEIPEQEEGIILEAIKTEKVPLRIAPRFGEI